MSLPTQEQPQLLHLDQLRFELGCRADRSFQAAQKNQELGSYLLLENHSNVVEVPRAALMGCLWLLGGLELFHMVAEGNQKWDG